MGYGAVGAAGLLVVRRVILVFSIVPAAVQTLLHKMVGLHAQGEQHHHKLVTVEVAQVTEF